MDKDYFDASLGLAFSLKAFERYRKSGLLQAELHHVPGIRGQCTGYLQLIEGKITSCYVEDKNGQRYPLGIDILVRVDAERGPFEWKLTTQPAPPSSTPPTNQPYQKGQLSSVPRIIAPLEPEMGRLTGWTAKQKYMLAMVYEAVDGRKTIEDIQREVPLSPNNTEEALRILVALKVLIVV
ncbi:MAG TPA: hypothetical protein VHZ51_20520 [Ktedonobacteraceae bacterium]|nr:hypothetical protein [Ktedonobacteraceae bacterium]